MQLTYLLKKKHLCQCANTKINAHTCTPIIMKTVRSLITFNPHMLMFLHGVTHLLQMYCWPGCHRFSLSHGQLPVSIHFTVAWKSICKVLNHAWENHREHEFIIIFSYLRHCSILMLLQTGTILKSSFVGAHVRVHMTFPRIQSNQLNAEERKNQNKTVPHCICMNWPVAMQPAGGKKMKAAKCTVWWITCIEYA